MTTTLVGYDPTRDKPPVRPLPKFCSHCGRELVLDREFKGYDRHDGTELWGEWLTCPRWHRSWRNLWVGDPRHDSPSADPHSWLERRWM